MFHFSEFSLLGLLLIAIGTGGIKPCVAAFGGDQFKLPEQARQLQTFFSVFYFSINAGSLISTFITPIFRQDIQCFGDDTCYALAFGVPALLMLVATAILVVGDKTVGYTHKAPQGSILTQVFGAIGKKRKRFYHYEICFTFCENCFIYIFNFANFSFRICNEEKNLFK